MENTKYEKSFNNWTEIKEAVDNDEIVYWENHAYTVVKHGTNEEYFIKHVMGHMTYLDINKYNHEDFFAHTTQEPEDFYG